MGPSERRLRHRLARRARDLRGAVTVEEAAARAGMHARHWQKIEAADVNVTLRTLARVAEALGVDPAELLRPAE